MDRKRLADLGKKARQGAEEHFTLNAMAAKTLEALAELERPRAAEAG